MRLRDIGTKLKCDCFLALCVRTEIKVQKNLDPQHKLVERVHSTLVWKGYG